MSKHYLRARWSDRSSTQFGDTYSTPPTNTYGYKTGPQLGHSQLTYQPHAQCNVHAQPSTHVQSNQPDYSVYYKSNSRISPNYSTLSQMVVQQKPADLFDLYKRALINQDVEIADMYQPYIRSFDRDQCEILYYELCRRGLSSSVLHMMNYNTFNEKEMTVLSNGWHLAQVYGHNMLADRMDGNHNFKIKWYAILFNCCRPRRLLVNNDEERSIIIQYILNGYLTQSLDVKLREIEIAFARVCRANRVELVKLFVRMMNFDANTYVRNQLLEGFSIYLTSEIWACITDVSEEDIKPIPYPTRRHSPRITREMSYKIIPHDRTRPPTDPRLRRR